MKIGGRGKYIKALFFKHSYGARHMHGGSNQGDNIAIPANM